MKTITTTHEIDATPEEVWNVLLDFPSHEKWNPFFPELSATQPRGSPSR